VRDGGEMARLAENLDEERRTLAAGKEVLEKGISGVP